MDGFSSCSWIRGDEMNRLHLETCFPIQADGPSHALPVLVDLNWFGQVLTSDNSGIIPSRSSYSCAETENEVIL